MNASKFGSLLLSLVFLFEVTSSQAADQLDDGAVLSASDSSALTAYFSDFVYTMKQDVYVYHWFNNGGSGPWATSTSAQDPLGPWYVKSGAPGYWRSQGDDGGGNMYGRGLYLAVDPVASESFGGPTWSLLQIRLKKDFRFLNLGRDGRNSIPMKVQNILAKLQCPTFWNDRSGGFSLLMGIKDKAKAPCLAALQKVFNEELAIDAFAYNYAGSQLEGCTSRERNSAFVLTNDRSVDASDVRYFTANTRDDLEERVRLQSLFSIMKDSAASGPLSAKTVSNGYSKSLLWADLEGHAFDAAAIPWAIENLYACKNEAQYE